MEISIMSLGLWTFRTRTDGELAGFIHITSCCTVRVNAPVAVMVTVPMAAEVDVGGLQDP
jgi:hypothetical protein